MDIFFELTRRCDMTCSHCLRGDAQGKDIPEHLLYDTFRMFGDYIDRIGIGGGEPSLRPELLRTLRHVMIHARTYPDSLFLVTNGKRLVQELDNKDYYFPDDIEGPFHTAIRELAWNTQVEVSVSTDRWHDDGSEHRYHTIEQSFEFVKYVSVNTHGPVNISNLVGIGRAKGYKSLEMYLGEECNDIAGYHQLYVNINGDIFISCDLSYEMMDNLKGTGICLGNVSTSTFEEVNYNFKKLSAFDKIELWEGMLPEEVEEQLTLD